MKKLYPVLLTVIVLLAIQSNAQVNAGFLQTPVPKPNIAIPFGKKLPPPDLTKYPGYPMQGNARAGTQNSLMQSLNFRANNGKGNPESLKQTIMQMRNNRMQAVKNSKISSSVAANANTNFHLTKDINALAESYPSDYTDLGTQPYAILNGVIYFAADDGIHGNELWRSDGTEAGTYMVKDIEAGTGSSAPFNITAANGKIYFDVITSAYGDEPWVSDGTEGGTQLLLDINPGINPSFPMDFTAVGNKVYFVTYDSQLWGELWQTDGTPAGTTVVKNIGDEGIGYFIIQLTAANGLLFFTLYSFPSNSYELWRSDGTDAGTYHVGTNAKFSYSIPLQLTNYNHQLYFSADDGTGRKLWVSDGTDAGTGYARKNNNVLIDADNVGTHFPVLNNVLYMSGTSLTTGTALYKYDAANRNGVAEVKDLTTDTLADFIVPSEMHVVYNTLFFKVENYNGTPHDELWSSGGDRVSTSIVHAFKPGETTYNLWDGGGKLYFIKRDKNFGAELWTLVETPYGSHPVIVRDIFNGSASSNPNFLTDFKGQLFFSATDDKKGNELFRTNCLDVIYGANMVKDINTVATSGSYAGYFNGGGNFYGYMADIRSEVVFDAYENKYGEELYKSDGTEQGTHIINDIIPGETSSDPFGFFSGNNAVYFIAYSTDTSVAVYRSNGTKAGLQKVTPNLGSNYYLSEYAAANNGLVFYEVYDYSTNNGELWRSDGTAAGTYMLSSTVDIYQALQVVSNTAFFTGGDADHGYELWKSDGSINGTVMVKDINPGVNGSYPGGLFVYKNEVYFGANDGTNSNRGTGAGFWKSDGTAKGTVKLKSIDPWWGSNAASTARFFCISNGILYFSALQYADGKGTELWKTDGTKRGTQFIKDINPTDTSVTVGPYYLTDVNGTVFFTADDGVHGTELWKTDGTHGGTQLVKDITPGQDPSYLDNLISYAGKLYFTSSDTVWSSDGTQHGTQPVNDPLISQLQVSNMVVACNQLFISAYTYKYGFELYAGIINEDRKFVASAVTNSSAKTIVDNMLLYPNPAKDVVNVNLGSINTGKANVQVINVAGSILINKEIESPNKQNVVQLNVSQLAAGTYFIKIISADGTKTLVAKFEKQ